MMRISLNLEKNLASIVRLAVGHPNQRGPLSRRMAAMPASGPGTNSSDAQRQPVMAATRGRSSMVTMVRRKPKQV